MAGHSKWANIRFRKGKQDAKRGKVFTRLIREVMVAAKDGGDTANNPKLRLAVDKALRANMTKDSIHRAISKATGEGNDVNLQERVYEGYGPGGIAVLVQCFTDNRNRTVAEVRHAFTKHGGSLGTDGSVAYLFRNVAVIQIETDLDEDAILEPLLDFDIIDMEAEDSGFMLEVAAADFHAVIECINGLGWQVLVAEQTKLPNTSIFIDNEKVAGQIIKMMARLDELDDVQATYANYEIEQSLLEKLG